jgi:ankyrin repeat protein
VRHLLAHPEGLQLVNARACEDHTAMHIAAVNGNREIVQELIDKVVYSFLFADFYGEPAVY